MTQQEITEGNKLIAEFMGFKFHDDDKVAYRNGYYYKNDEGDRQFFEAIDFQYHSSWDWLMPVVEKIESNGCIVEIWLSLGRGCRIHKVLSKIKSWQTVQESNSTIEATWLAVVEFIKWLNHNDSNPVSTR